MPSHKHDVIVHYGFEDRNSGVFGVGSTVKGKVRLKTEEGGGDQPFISLLKKRRVKDVIW